MRIEKDKWKHFYVGILMGVVVQTFLEWLLPDHLLFDTILSFLVVIGVSYGFELFSKFTGKGHYEVMDAVAAVIGGLMGMGAVLLVKVF